MFNTVEEIIADIKAGKMVVVTDDKSRENEGDLVFAASHVTPDKINFMAKRIPDFRISCFVHCCYFFSSRVWRKCKIQNTC